MKASIESTLRLIAALALALVLITQSVIGAYAAGVAFAVIDFFLPRSWKEAGPQPAGV